MKTTFLGLGLIGNIWAANLRTDGWPVRVWNRTPKEVPGFCAEPSEAVAESEIIFIVVSDITAVMQILQAIRPTLKPGQIVVQSSTITPEAVKEAAVFVQSQGADFLDAPFTGSKPAAEKRETVFFIGGEEAVLARARPALERLSKAILPMGAIGTASAIKLAMNLNIAQVGQALSESLALARHAGLSDEAYFHALGWNVSKSGLADLKETKLREKNYAPQFSLKHMLKDLRQARSLAGSLPLPQLDRTIEIYERGMQAGWADDDFIGLIRLLTQES